MIAQKIIKGIMLIRLKLRNKIPHVIVCDDDPELNPFIRNFFKLDGFETHQALSAQECMDKLAELGDAVDVITVDGKIASDRNAMLILNVKRINKNVKVFVLANRGLSEDKTRMMDYGADEFATKPLSMESLINKVNMKLLEDAKDTS
ncbi:MAG: response regulator [Thermoproteota archaeon]|nr:response regulator [Thermoproteota archaeon]